jgi:hypothetical protein
MAEKEKDKPNGLVKFQVDDVLRYKLFGMHMAVQKLEAEKATVETKILAAQADKQRVVQEILSAHEKRLKGNYNMSDIDFGTGLGTFSAKEKTD